MVHTTQNTHGMTREKFTLHENQLALSITHSGRFLEPWDSFIWWLLGLHHVTHNFTHSLCSMDFNLHGVSMGHLMDLVQHKEYWITSPHI